MAQTATERPFAGPPRRRPLRTTLVAIVAVVGCLVGFTFQDAWVETNRSSGFFPDGYVAANATRIWQHPPAGPAARPFRWGISEWGGPRPGAPTLSPAEWEAKYTALAPDMVRQFVGWRIEQPSPGATISGDSLADAKMDSWARLGFEVQLTVNMTPDWAAQKDLGTLLGGYQASTNSPPIGFAQPEGPYNQFLRQMKDRWPNIAIAQIWNEPDYPRAVTTPAWNPFVVRSWRGSATEYGQMLTASAKGLATWPQRVEVSSGAVTHPNYVAAMLATVDVPAVDVWDYHLACPPGDTDESIDLMLALADAQAGLLAPRGTPKPAFSISELSYPYVATDPTRQAQFLAKAYAVGKALGWATIIWWTIHAFDPTYYPDTGLVNIDGSPRPAFGAYTFNHATLRAAQPDGLGGDGTTTRIAKLRSTSGRPLWVAWSPSGAGSVTWPGDAGPANVFDVTGAAVGRLAPGAPLALDRTVRYVVPA